MPHPRSSPATSQRSTSAQPRTLAGKAFLSPRVLVGLVVGVWVLHLAPYFLLGGAPYIRIHDTLEGEWIWLSLLVRHQAQWAGPEAFIPEMMGGLPRVLFPTGYSGAVLWLWLLGPVQGYVVNYWVLHALGFLGLYGLLTRHVLPPSSQRGVLALFVALVFSLLPIFSPFGLTVMGQPLLLWAFLDLQEKPRRLWPWLLVLVFPFYSSLVWGAPYILGGLGVLWLLRGVRRRQFQPTPFFALLVLAGGYLLANPQLLQVAANPPFPLHRQAYAPFAEGPPSWGSVLGQLLQAGLALHYHVGTYLTVPSLVLAAWALQVGRRSWPLHRLVRSLLGVILGIVVFYAMYDWLMYSLGEALPLLVSLRFNRVTILLPLLWMLVLAGALGLLVRVFFEQDKQGQATPGQAVQEAGPPAWSSGLARFSRRGVRTLALTSLVLAGVANDELLHNWRSVAGAPTKPDMRQFWAPKLFTDIKMHIDRPLGSYRVVCLGFNPSVAQLNGLHTLDGLMALYPLAYKQRFRQVLAPELAKSAELRQYFDGWGNRCYLFSHELGMLDPAYMNSKHDSTVLQDYQLDAQALLAMGGEYLLSAVEIANPQATGLSPEGVFSNREAWWRLYLYRVTPEGRQQGAPSPINTRPSPNQAPADVAGASAQ